MSIKVLQKRDKFTVAAALQEINANDRFTIRDSINSLFCAAHFSKTQSIAIIYFQFKLTFLRGELIY